MYVNFVLIIFYWYYFFVLCNFFWQIVFVIKICFNEFNVFFCDKEVFLWLRDKQMSDKLMEFCMCMELIRIIIFQNLFLFVYFYFKLEIFVNKFINFSVFVCLFQSIYLIYSFIIFVFNKYLYYFLKICFYIY